MTQEFASLAPIQSSLDALGITAANHTAAISNMEMALSDHSDSIMLEKKAVCKLTIVSKENAAFELTWCLGPEDKTCELSDY